VGVWCGEAAPYTHHTSPPYQAFTESLQRPYFSLTFSQYNIVTALYVIHNEYRVCFVYLPIWIELG
jgi:hypothetical protein